MWEKIGNKAVLCTHFRSLRRSNNPHLGKLNKKNARKFKNKKRSKNSFSIENNSVVSIFQI